MLSAFITMMRESMFSLRLCQASRPPSLRQKTPLLAWEKSMSAAGPFKYPITCRRRLKSRPGVPMVADVQQAVGRPSKVPRRRPSGQQGSILPSQSGVSGHSWNTAQSYAASAGSKDGSLRIYGSGNAEKGLTKQAKPISWWDVHFGGLKTTERTPRHLISPLGLNWVATDSVV